MHLGRRTPRKQLLQHSIATFHFFYFSLCLFQFISAQIKTGNSIVPLHNKPLRDMVIFTEKLEFGMHVKHVKNFTLFKRFYNRKIDCICCFLSCVNLFPYLSCPHFLSCFMSLLKKSGIVQNQQNRDLQHIDFAWTIFFKNTTFRLSAVDSMFAA